MRWFCLLAALSAGLFAQLPAPNDAGVSMGHIHLMVADIDAQKKLWVGVLGAQASTDGPLELMKLPGVFIILQKPRTPLAEGSEGSTVDHFGFFVPSYLDMKARLAALNIPIASDIPARKQFTATFPDKVRVEFIEDATQKVPVIFHHIHIFAPGNEAVRDWYVKTFGGTAGKRRDWPSANLPGVELDFQKVAAPPAATKGRSLDHIGFEVKNLEAFCKKLAADGVTFDMAYRDVPALGLKIAFIVDPIGTRIELTEGLASK